jgi:hypothetical protein
MQPASRTRLRIAGAALVAIGSALGIAVLGGWFVEHDAIEQDCVAPGLGAYGCTSSYCGKGPIPRDIEEIPWIGCFSLSAGHTARGMLSNQHVEVTVDATGEEVFTVNGTVVRNVDPARSTSGTNVPFAGSMGVAGYRFCQDASRGCPSDIEVFSRNPDKSVLFMVAECLPPNYGVCVLDQENWDYEMRRSKRTN